MKKLIEIAKERGAKVMPAFNKHNLDYGTVCFESEAQLQATFDDYCKQFEPIYQISFGGVWHKFDKEYYDQCKFGSKRIVYLAPQQIPSEVKAYIMRLESALDECMEERTLETKPDCLKD